MYPCEDESAQPFELLRHFPAHSRCLPLPVEAGSKVVWARSAAAPAPAKDKLGAAAAAAYTGLTAVGLPCSTQLTTALIQTPLIKQRHL